MKLYKIVILLTMVLNLHNCSNKESTLQKTKTSKEALLNTIQKFNNAFKHVDIETLSTLVTENYQHTNGDAKPIGKKHWIDYLQKRKNAIISRNLHVDSYIMDQMAIELYDNTAIVTARISTTVKRSGKIQTHKYRVTNLWVNQSGQWKRAGFHDTKIK